MEFSNLICCCYIFAIIEVSFSDLCIEIDLALRVAEMIYACSLCGAYILDGEIS
jgi:hypothetical protein